MNARMTLPVQWTLALLVGLALGYAFRPAPAAAPLTATPTAVPATPTSTSVASTPSSLAPFTTLPGGWLVRVTFYRRSPPQIAKVIRLDEARLTVFPAGENRIQILNSSGQDLYDQFFQVEFLEGDPPMPVDQKVMFFVIPAVDGAAQILVQTPNGEASYDIPGR